MSNNIFTMYTKNQNKKAGRRGYYGWKSEVSNSINPCDYGDYLLQRNKRRNRRSK